jgi:putative transposase
MRGSMPPRDTPLCAGEQYHLYNLGNNRGRVFFQQDNYLFFLRRVREYLLPVVEIVAYCLMPTHYHLLVSTRERSDVSDTSEVSAGVSRAMMRLSVSYTKAVNKRRGRVGGLFQGAYRRKRVSDDAYLVHLSRYIHLNPVLDGLVEHPEEWEFSSYQEYAGLRNGTLPSPGIVLGHFGSAEEYGEFVESYAEADLAEWRDLA